MVISIRNICRTVSPVLLLMTTVSASAFAQENIMKAEHVNAWFFSETPVENIEAENTEGQAVLNAETGDLLCVIPIEGFEFEKRLMQKHFNSQYMESDKYPEATFRGKILGWSGIPAKRTSYRVAGELTMHGVTRTINERASLEPATDGLLGNSSFKVLLKDYNIKVPRIVIKNIAEEIEVRVRVNFDKP